MSFELLEGPRDTFALHGKRAVQLQSDGLIHPRSPGRSAPSTFTAYEDLTHVACTGRAFWLGSTQSAYVVPRRAFVDPRGPEKLVAALLALLAHRAGGSAQLARMAAVDAAARSAPAPRATWTLAVLCVAAYGLQLALGPIVYEVGYYSPALVEDGDRWRLLTANLLHGFPGFPLHLLLNLLALLALGNLVERPLGPARSICILGVSGAAAMATSGLAGYAEVVGASGMVFGLAGSVLWLEFHWTERLPAWWRFPRRALLGLLALNAALALALPFIAGAAHVGGFAAGLAGTALMARAPAQRRARGGAGWAVRVLASGVVGIALASLALAGRELRGEGFAARHAVRIARLPGISPIELNNRAWVIATSPNPTPEEIEAALELAERAVRDTGRAEATVLDTLAEVQFRLGWHELAVETIDEAIARDPDEPYYRAQRERFAHERPAEERPDPPPLWRTPQPRPAPTPVRGDRGITV